MNLRRNHELRLEAFDKLQELKGFGFSRREIVDKVHTELGIDNGTLYSWYRGTIPWGRGGGIKINPELFYVLGALMGDGCVYRWKPTNNYNILVGDKSFTAKYAAILNQSTDREVKPYIDRNKNIWFVKSNNYSLCNLFEKVRGDLVFLEKMCKDYGRKPSLRFVEGFFDAEGCVKIIKEKVRKTPKICLDITNTDFGILEVVRRIIREDLFIEARYSIQKAFLGKDGSQRKKCYHLRIYKKEYVRRFLEHIHTTKLIETKVVYVENWIKGIKIRKYT